MEINVEDLGNLKRKLTVTIPNENVIDTYNQIYNNLKKDIKVQGFRPGRYPQKLMEKRFKSYMEKEAIEKLVPDFFDKALKVENLKPATQPKFDGLKVDKKKPLVFEATFETFPDIELPDFSFFKLEKSEVVVSEEEYEKRYNEHLDRVATFAKKEGPAEDGDQAMIDFSVKVEDEDDKKEATNETCLIGSGRFLPDFESALIGMKAGEEKEFELTYPDDFTNEQYKGKKAEYYVKVNEVQSKQQPELNEEFLQKHYGDKVKTEEEFKQFIRDELQTQKEAENQREYRKDVVKQAKEMLEFEVPEENFQMSIRQKLNNKNFGEELSDDERKQKAEDEARDELRLYYFFEKIREQENISLNTQAVNERFYFNSLMMGVNPQELIQQEEGRNIIEEIKAVVLEEQILDFIVEKIFA